MSITRYREGEHPSGFIGWRVVVAFGNKYYQRYLSARAPSGISQKVWERYQETKAQYLEAGWKKRSAVYQYLTYVRSDHPRTLPYRGVGMHGLTADIRERAKGLWTCSFKVQLEKGGVRYFDIQYGISTFSEAWRKAVQFWSEENNIRTKDRDSKLNNPPAPDIFKNLRRQMNQEGYDIPPSALGPVYAEQREAIALRKASQTLQKPVHSVDVAAIQAWFEAQMTKAHG